MPLTSIAIYAPGDTIVASWANILRTNFSVLDARTGGDPGAADEMLVSDGAASAVWVARLTAVLDALGYTPIDKAGDTGIGDLSMNDLTAGDISAATVTTSSTLSAAAYAGGTIAAGSLNAQEINAGSAGIDSTGPIAGSSTVSAGAWAGGTIASGALNALAINAGATGIDSTGPISTDDTISAEGAVIGDDGANIGAGGVVTTGDVIANSGTISGKGVVAGSDGIAVTGGGTMAIGGQEVYWSGNPPPASAGGQLVGELRLIGATSLTAANAAGWLLCNGQAVSRTTHSALFGALGGTFGTGDGSTTFNVPDLRDRFPIGVSGTKALGSTGGAATVDATHDHSLGAAGVGGSIGGPSALNGLGNNGGVDTPSTTHTHDPSGLDVTGSTDQGGDATLDILNPYLALNYVIYSGVAT